MDEKQGGFSHNLNLYSIIKPKYRENRSKNNVKVSSIPICINKKKFQNSMYIQKKMKSNKLFFNFSLNKSNTNKSSLSKEKSVDDFSNDLLKTNDLNTLKKNMEVLKIEIDMINKMFKDNKNNIDNLMKKMEELNATKNNKQKLLENNLSKKETLDEMCKTILNNIKNNKISNNINENYNIEITLEEIKINNKDTFINRVFNAFNYINNYHDTRYFNYISITINQAYMDLYSCIKDNKAYNINNLIKNFFYIISIRIVNQIMSKTTEKCINILLHFLLKINIISENIDKVINFLEHDYNDQKIEIIKKIKEIENKILSLKNKRNELIILKNKLDERIDIFTRKKTPFCERTIYPRKMKGKNLTLNFISSSVHFSTEFFNKSVSNSTEKNKTDNNESNSQKKENIDESKKINIIKFLNKQNKTEDYRTYKTYHSNKISEGKIIINGISGNSSCEKKNNYINKIKIKEINNKLKKIGWTQKKQSDNAINNKTKQNGKINDFKENSNNNLKIKDSSNFINLTEVSDKYNPNSTQENNYNFKNNLIFDNGKYSSLINKAKSKDYGLFVNVNNNYTQNKNIKTERLLPEESIKKTLKTKKHNKSVLNGNLKPVFKSKKFNLSKLFSLCENTSFERTKTSINSHNDNNMLNKYLTNREIGKTFIKSDDNIIHYQKINKSPKNLIYRMKDQSKIINEEKRNRVNIKSSLNGSDKPNISLNIQTTSYIYNDIESFCYYKYLDDESNFFNPLSNNINFNKLGYNEGFISIDIISSCLKIVSNNFSSNNNKDLISNSNTSIDLIKSKSNSGFSKLNNINIELKEITNIYLNKLMKNIIKIHDIFMKYNSSNKSDMTNNNENGLSKKKISNINKLLNIKEIMNIKDMEQSEKIKAGLCNFFSFVIEFENSKKIEFILVNYAQFNTWFNYLKDITSNNIKSKLSIPNGNSNNLSTKSKNNNLFQLKTFYTKLKSRQKEDIRRSITEKKVK